VVGIANSMGVGGMQRLLNNAIKNSTEIGLEEEKAIGKQMLSAYVAGDPNAGPNDQRIVRIGFGKVAGSLNETGIGHRGRRAYQIFRLFPPTRGATFTELGDFSLSQSERKR
jgi:hypothetical protein